MPLFPGIREGIFSETGLFSEPQWAEKEPGLLSDLAPAYFFNPSGTIAKGHIHSPPQFVVVVTFLHVPGLPPAVQTHNVAAESMNISPLL